MMSGRASRILFVQYTNPAAYPPLQHSTRILAQAGWEVLVLGIAMPGVHHLRFPVHPGITVCYRRAAPPGWRMKFNYAGFVLWALAQALRWRPRWVYASDLLAAPAALVLAAFAGVSLLYHEHDTPATSATLFIRACLWARRKMAQRADLCIVPNTQRAGRFAREVRAARVYCVWNCPMPEEVTPPSPARVHGSVAVLYHGNIAPTRLPAATLRAIALLPETVTLRIVGYEAKGYPGYVHQLMALATELGLDGRVEYVGAVSRSELIRWGSGCDVGLALMPMRTDDPNLRDMVGASNKPFDYLAWGLALLVSDLPEWRRVYVDAGYGLACDPEDPASIAAALRWFLEHPAERQAMGEGGRQRILTQWNYERQFAPVVSYLRDRTHV